MKRRGGMVGASYSESKDRRGSAALTEEQVWKALADVFDPEIPSVSVVDLGVVRDLAVEGNRVRIAFTPTYLGCPALTQMRDRITRRIRAIGAEAEVEVVLDEVWTTDRITPVGRERLREAGIGLPAPRAAERSELAQLQRAVFYCPYCGSANTRLESVAGPTPCRSIRFCTRCERTFEQFKTV